MLQKMVSYARRAGTSHFTLVDSFCFTASPLMKLCLFGHCARLYCLTVRCDAVLADLESLSVVAAILSVALLGAALYTRLHAPSALAIGLLMVLCILYAVRSRREQVRQASEERAVLSLNAHRCWDRHRCTRGFTVFVWSWNATMKKNQPWWALPPPST